MSSGAVDIPSSRGARDRPSAASADPTTTSGTAGVGSATKSPLSLSAASPKWADTSAPIVSPRNRKLSVLDVASSPMAVNFHTWRVNALTTNAYRQAQFLEHAQKAFAAESRPGDFDKRSLKILQDLGFAKKGPQQQQQQQQQPQSNGYASLRTLLLAPTSSLSDAEWLVSVKTFLAAFPELFDEFKEAFGVREEDAPQADDTTPLVELEVEKPLVRRSSSKVQFDHPPTPGVEALHEDATYFPPTPAPLDNAVLPFDFHDSVASPYPMDSTDTPQLPEVDPSAAAEPNEVCLNGHYIAYDLHVAMMDRPNEMRDLIQRNPEIFENVQHACGTDERWLELEDVFYTPREEMDDLTWMKAISSHMEGNPSLLAMLKELVGYDMHEEVFDAEDSDSDVSLEDINAAEEPQEKVEWLDTVVKMRDMPEIMARLENDYPQFFANVKKALSGEDETEYDHFIAAFFSSPGTLSDDEWEAEIQRYLSRAKTLMGQLREIALYELDIDESPTERADNLFEPPVPAGPVTAGTQPSPLSATPQTPTSRIEVKSRADANTIRELETDHPLFFNLLRKHLSSRDEYHRFLRVLYAPREAISDEKWEPLITRRFLSTSRRLRQMFREVVDATVIATSEVMNSDDEDYQGCFEVPLRGLPDASQRILRLTVAHADHFSKIKRRLGDQYGRFTALLVTPRDDLTDDKWAERIEGFLEGDVKLTAEFASIVGVEQVRTRSRDDKSTAPSATHAQASHPSHIAIPPPQIPTITHGVPVSGGSPAPPSETEVQFAVREQLASSIPQLEFYMELKTAVDDDKAYGKILHALIEHEETEKIVAREREEGGGVVATAAAPGSLPGPAGHARTPSMANVIGGNMDAAKVMDAVHEVVGEGGDVSKRVEAWLAAKKTA
ncbi:hypothetical protein HDU87_008270 [Geranomyces variabilis]|uniref:Uncharacterized protein n=1 Tax=Geranomyces variabilis TaxID=109894 RepID=A0AAD5TEQ1_9FUNG|nr:hypothetical protein HDU87_008270 [Geranomyces variabilis]